MTFRFLIPIFLLTAPCANATGDTLNYTDNNGQKQGWWIITGKDKKNYGYADYAKVEEGMYLDNQKTGTWKNYYPSGKLKSTITYVKNRPNGPAKTYFENGCIAEEGMWNHNRWVEDYKLYREDSCGVVQTTFHFNKNGKREGPSGIRPFDGKVMIEGDFTANDTGAVKKYKETPDTNGSKGKTRDNIRKPGRIFTKKDSLLLDSCSCGLILPDREPRKGETIGWDGKGFTKLYNMDKAMEVCGYFENYKLQYGFDFIYNKEKVLERIDRYFKGKKVGECSIK